MMSKPSLKWLVAVIAGFLSLFIVHYPLFIAQAQSLTSPIVINELQYHPASEDHGEEYIELYNTAAITVDLSGWVFSDGVAYTFPISTFIPPGGYVVVANEPTVVEAVYGISGVLGPFESGRLANGGERVALEDALGGFVDEVAYDDHRPWPELPDGRGPSLELINPTFDNTSPCSWGASQPFETSLGTPGVQNSVYSPDNVPPCITDVAHTPIFPTSSQSVTVTALVDDNMAVVTVTLHYRSEGTSEYVMLPMVDDGSGGDTVAGDLLYTAIVTASEHDDGSYVEFYVTAADDEGAERIVPDGAPGGTSDETGQPVTISYIYQVEDTPPTGTLPIYRLIFTHENWTELTTRDLYSNILLDATFVYSKEVFYNVGVRYRGESSRNVWPRPYRIKFRDEHEFEDRERINLLSDELGREALSHDLFQRAGLPAPDTRFVTLYVNETKHGDYLDVEQVDNDFLEAHFPDDRNGNLYRGFDGADLSYRGPNPDDYRPYYLKKNNEDADDYADVIALTDALTNSPDETLLANAEAVADMRQWLRWFAVQAVLDNHEGALWMGIGDDYFLYHRPSDDRFVLISWDHNETFKNPTHTIWEPDWYATEIVKRILHYPPFTRWYYQSVADIAANEFSAAEMVPRIDALPDVVSSGDRRELKEYVAARVPKLNSEIPYGALSISTNGGVDIVTTQSEITLEGTCSPLRDVYVNGDPSRVEYPAVTTWRYTSTLWARDNVFVITDGLDSRTIAVYKDIFHGGVLTENTTLTTSQLPYAITSDIVVPEGITLTIEPGVTLHFQADRTLRVEGGRLLAEGTATQPILFTRQGDAYWGGILFKQTQADNQIRHAVIEYTHEAIPNPRTHGISAYGAWVTVADSTIRYTGDSAAVQALAWENYTSTLYLLRNEIVNIQGDGVSAADGYVFIQGNHIHDISYNNAPLEGIELSDVVTASGVLDNHIHDVSDDCLDLNGSSVVVGRNRIHHCGDKGISIGQPSSTTLVNNLVYGCLGDGAEVYSGIGIAIKDGAVSRIVNNTVSDNKCGIYLYERETGRGGGAATVVNAIVWGNETDLKLDALSTIAVTYSDVYSVTRTVTGTGTAIWPGKGNINADPLFRAPQNGSYRLLNNSPCIDVGTEVGVPNEDIWGVYRPHGDGYDLGAHEFFEYFSCYLPLILRSQ
jgi:parallel beta-helix repeat protein